MSDDNTVYFKALRSVFQCRRKLLCNFHVAKCWERKAKRIVDHVSEEAEDERKKIKDKLLSMTKRLRLSTDKFMAAERLQELEAYANEKKVQEYVAYLKQYYMQRPRQWMARFRYQAPINSNNYCESCHSLMKSRMVARSWSGRADNAVCNLVTFIYDNVKEITFFNKQGSQSHRMRLIKMHHNDFKKCAHQFHIEKEGWRTWTIRTDNKPFHEIMITQISTSACCDMICKECGACKHMFVCDCLPMPSENGFCKHIHAVCQHIISEDPSTLQFGRSGPQPMEVSPLEFNDGNGTTQTEDSQQSLPNEGREQMTYLFANYDNIIDRLEGQQRIAFLQQLKGLFDIAKGACGQFHITLPLSEKNKCAPNAY